MAIISKASHSILASTIDDRVLKDLTAEDELGVVLRAQIHIEASVTEFIETIVMDPDRLPRLRFQDRVQLACALGLKGEYFEALKFFGDLRNRFAHKLDTRLDDATVNELYAKLPRAVKEVTLRLRPGFEALATRQRFAIIVVVLKSILVDATDEAVPMG